MKRVAKASPASRRRRPEPPGTAWTLACLAGVLGLQLWTCAGTLTGPFLDTRLHYHFDNASFSFMARNGNRLGDLRSQFGVTQSAYSRWEVPRGGPSYYTDHPFLLKAVFQQYTRLVGTDERASRSFYLALSFGVAAGLFVIVLRTTGRLDAALAGAATLVSLPLFASYQTCVKFETDGMLVSVWLFVALLAFLGGGSTRSLALYGALATAAFLSHWTSALFVAFLAAFLQARVWRRGDPNGRRALAVTAFAAALGLTLLFAAMAYEQGSPTGALRALAGAFVKRSAPIPPSAWWSRQAAFSLQNFGRAFPWAFLAVGAFAAARWARAGNSPPGESSAMLPGPRELLVFILATLSVAATWLVAFPQGSFIHVYWQLWFCLPLATVAGAFVASLPREGLGRGAGFAAAAALVVLLAVDARAARASILDDQLGTPDDLAFLISLRPDPFDRFLFVPVTDTPLNAWFQGPLFEYYTDRAVAVAASPSDAREGDKLLVLRYRPREDVARRLAEWSGKGLTNEKCGSRICAYDVVAAAPDSPGR